MCFKELLELTHSFLVTFLKKGKILKHHLQNKVRDDKNDLPDILEQTGCFLKLIGTSMRDTRVTPQTFRKQISQTFPTKIAA